MAELTEPSHPAPKGKLTDSLKGISKTQWVLIAGAGLGLGILIRYRNKNKAAATTSQTTGAMDTSGVSQGYFSGTGQTGYIQGNAVLPTTDPNAASNVGSTPVSVTPGTLFNTPISDLSPIPVAIINTNPPVPPTPATPTPVATPPPAPAGPPPAPAPIVMSQQDYLNSVGMNYNVFSQPGGYLDKFFANPNQVQIIGGTGTPATTTQVLADLQARGLPINPNWKPIN